MKRTKIKASKCHCILARELAYTFRYLIFGSKVGSYLVLAAVKMLSSLGS